jgi:hypothetical protein
MAGQYIALFFIVTPLSLIDLLMDAINIFSGMETIGNESQTIFDIFFNQSVINRALWSVTVISMTLCLGFSIFAVVRSMGDTEQKRPLGAVLGSTVKAMLTFLLVPLLCIICINIAGLTLRQINILLRGGDGNRPVSMSGTMFVKATLPKDVHWLGWFAEDPNEKNEAWSVFWDVVKNDDGMTWDKGRSQFEEIWQYLVNDMVNTRRIPGYWAAEMPESGSIRLVYVEYTSEQMSDRQRRDRHAQLTRMYQNGERSVAFGHFDRITLDFNVYNMLTSPNYYVMIITSFMMIIMLFMSLLIFLQRIFELLLLYLAAPFFVAPMPLDEGAKFKSWRDAFVGKTIAGFSTIITLQMLILLMPVILDPELLLHVDPAANAILKALLIVGGFFAAYKSHTFIASIASPGTASTESATSGLIGGFMMGKALNPIGAVAGAYKSLSDGVKSAVKPFSEARDTAKTVGNYFGVGGEKDNKTSQGGKDEQKENPDDESPEDANKINNIKTELSNAQNKSTKQSNKMQ